MERIVIANTFTLRTLSREFHEVTVEPVSTTEIKRLLRERPYYSVVGHESTARVFSAILGVDVPYNREDYRLQPGDLLIVGILNSRLPEGIVLSEEELESIDIDWRLIRWA